MVRVNPFQPNFNAGELSPRLIARTDFAKYPSACAMLRNLVLMPQGGASRRPGTRFAWETKNSAEALMRSFRFSSTDAYPLEIGKNYIRFGRNQGAITVAATNALIANGDFTSNITGWDDISTGGAGNAISHDATNGRLTLETSGTAADDIGWAEQDVTTSNINQEHVISFEVIGAPGDKIEFQVGTTSGGSQILAAVEKEVGYHVVAFTPTASPFYVQFRNKGANADKNVQIDNVRILGDEQLEIVTPWDDPKPLRFAQSADVKYVASGNTTPIYRLERHGHTTWSLEEVLFEDGPYLDENITTTTLTLGAASGLGVSLTASSVVGINNNQGFLATDIGRLVRIKVGSNEPGWGIIVSRTSSTVVAIDVKRSFGATTASAAWRLGAWSKTTGYPRALTFFEQRFVAAGTNTQPQTFWMSQSADLENMRPDSWVSGAIAVEDDDALDFTIAAEDVQTILWLSAGKQLVIGTASGQWVANSEGAVMTPTDIGVTEHTKIASADVAPVRVGNTVLFLQRSRRKIREFVYNFQVDSFVSSDMTILANHIGKGGIIEFAHQAEPDGVLWAVRRDGRLLSFTYDPLEEVRGWAQHILGGSFEGGQAVVESVTTLPGNDDAGQVISSVDRDEVWLVVKRTIDGVTKRYVEFLEAGFEGPLQEDYDTVDEWKEDVVEEQKDAFYIDCGLTYEGIATTIISNLDHLEGETVGVLVDGATHPDAIVSGGQITLEYAGQKVQVGLKYRHQYKSLKIAAGASAGTSVAKIKRVHAITFILLDSAHFDTGRKVGTTNTIEFREVADAMDTAVPLFTGEKYSEFDGDWDRDSRIYLEGDAPLPFYLVAIAPEMQTNDLK